MFKTLLILGIIISVLIIIIRYLWIRNSVLITELNQVLNRKQSLSVKYGKMTEQFLPFIETYPYDERNFRFIGNPIDGIQFETDKIIIVEFKTANSGLSPRQKKIRDLVNDKKVYFKEFNIK